MSYDQECVHGVPFAAICDDCQKPQPITTPTPQQLLGELMDAAGVYNDGSTPAVLWDRCIRRVKEMRTKEMQSGRPLVGRSWS